MAEADQFQSYMDEGYNASWDQDWKAAIEAYTKAIRLKPEDPDAHINLGLALLNDKQLEQALKVYQRASRLAPDDPLPLERSADVLERMGQLKHAAQQYIKVSDVYLGMRDLDKAIGNWERATQLTPGLVSVHGRLAQAYERVGDKQKAIRQYLTLAFNFRRKDDMNKAIRAVERALRLDRNHPQALNTLRALKSGGEVVLPEDLTTQKRPETRQEENISFDVSFEDAKPELGEANPLGPIGEALNEALSVMAAFSVESGFNNTYIMHAMQGMEYQRQDMHEQAIAAYRNASNEGMNHPSLQLNLGGLLLLTEDYEDAIAYLPDAINFPNKTIAAGALHGLGQGHYYLNNHKEAATYLIQSLRAVDTELTLDEDEVDELTNVYERLLTALEGRTTDALRVINERFIGLLSGKDWKQRIAETRRHLDETLRDEGGQGAVDFLVAKGSDDLAEIVTSIDRYIRQNLYVLAMDEAHRAVEKSPFYLPVHVRMAEVMMKEGRIRPAIDKYNMVARSYLVREENDRAASILGEVLEMAPLDVEVRTNLIELLENEERWPEALDQYIDLAETYQQLGDFDSANTTYRSAEQMAKRIEAPPKKMVSIKHHIADIAQMRLNTRQAQKIYEDVLEILPQDEKALRSLIEIYYSQGNQVEAVRRLDKLLSIYVKKREVRRITQLLEELVSMRQNDTALRSRLASIYKKLGQKQQAIEQYDALGELQLEAGLTREAAKTIRQIIALGPDRVEDYKQLLSQLNS